MSLQNLPVEAPFWEFLEFMGFVVGGGVVGMYLGGWMAMRKVVKLATKYGIPIEGRSLQERYDNLNQYMREHYHGDDYEEL